MGWGRSVCLFVGQNNSGKSSLLEAAGLILRPFEAGQWVQTATHRDRAKIRWTDLAGAVLAIAGVALLVRD